MTKSEWDGIPQEKFDAMGKAIEKSQNIRELKIKSIDISDYKNIEYINTELGDINIIGGLNGNGKSSFAESIFVCIQGNIHFGKGKIQPAQLIKKGENEATITMQVSGKEEEYIVKRIFKKGTKAKPQGTTKLIATKNGEEIKQAELNEILKAVTIDPIELGNLSITEQIKEIKQATGLNTDEIDTKISDKEEARKESKRYAKERETIYDDLTASGVPEKIEKTSVSELIDNRSKIEELDKFVISAKDKKEKIEEWKKRLITEEEKYKKIVADIETELSGLSNEKENIESEGGAFYNNVIKKLPIQEISKIDEKIANIETENDKADKYIKYIEAKKELKVAKVDKEKDEELVDNLRKERVKLISESNLPKYMEISDEVGILVDGIEFKLLNTARKIEVVIDLIFISKSPLRTIRIENGGELDIKTLKDISEKILKAGFQGFFERPIIDKYDSIIISDGELLDGKEKDDFINKQ